MVQICRPLNPAMSGSADGALLFVFQDGLFRFPKCADFSRSRIYSEDSQGGSPLLAVHGIVEAALVLEDFRDDAAEAVAPSACPSDAEVGSHSF